MIRTPTNLATLSKTGYTAMNSDSNSNGSDEDLSTVTTSPSNGTHRIILPPRRFIWTQKVTINGTVCYLTCGEYKGGKLGEIFIVIAKAGQDMRAILESFAMTFSLALQHGTPLETLVNTLRGMQFNPYGPVEGGDGCNVTECSSIIDWVCQELENTYLKEQPS